MTGSTYSCPINSNIRPMYCPTKYFNASYPDQYTYLQYWRRRMCYNTYLYYSGVNVPIAPKCKVYDKIINYTSHAY